MVLNRQVPWLELREVTKLFGGTAALKGISFSLGKGDVAGLIGENGAGKSTLIKILSGVHKPDHGKIFLEGRETHFGNPHHAIEQGIATIHQELNYFEKLTVAENLFLGGKWPRRRWGGVHWEALFARAARTLREFDLEIPPHVFFHELSPAQRQEVAIVRALSHRAGLLILDEPTASLTEPEVARLMAHLRKLKEQGITLIYVSHRLDEIQQITNRVIVLRDGQLVADYPTSEATIPRMVRDMVGRDIAAQSSRARNAPGKVILKVEGLTRPGLFSDITFQVREGEVVGLAGLVGAGRSELARCVYGLYAQESGEIEFDGRPWRPTEPAAACRAGLVYVPEERKRQGFALDHSTGEGISIGFLRSISRSGLISRKKEKAKVGEAITRFAVKVRTPNQPVGTLSGGNQQKVLLARWLESNPKLIILDEPTRGVDVGAKAEIHRLVDELARGGKGVLLISSDLPELLALSDRVCVLHQGRIATELSGRDMTQENVLLAASGLRH